MKVQLITGGAMLTCRKEILSTMLVITLTLLSSCASKKDKLREKQAALYMGSGTQNLIEQKYTDALTNLLKANELAPNNSEILNNLGMAYYFKGERELGMRYLNQALKLNPENSDVLVNMASIQFKDANYNEAEKLYKEVLKHLTYDKQARTYYNLGLLELQGRKNPIAARSYFQQSIKEDDNFCPSHLQIGLMNFEQRKFNQALTNFKNASIGTCYESPAPHYYQAITLVELNRYDEAMLKFAEIDTRFKNSVYAVKARTKSIELSALENKNKNKSAEPQASRTMLESPEF